MTEGSPEALAGKSTRLVLLPLVSRLLVHLQIGDREFTVARIGRAEGSKPPWFCVGRRPTPRPPRDGVIREGSMAGIDCLGLWHVTSNAIRPATTIGRHMTGSTFVAVPNDSIPWRRMRIVHVLAPHLVSGRLFAAAGVHAFNMACASKRGTFRIVTYKIRYVVSEGARQLGTARTCDPASGSSPVPTSDIAGRHHHAARRRGEKEPPFLLSTGCVRSLGDDIVRRKMPD